MNSVMKYEVPMKRKVIYVSALQILLPIIVLASFIPGSIIVLCIAGLLSISLIFRSILKPGLEVTERKVVVRNPFHTEIYDIDQIEAATLVRTGRDKHVIGLKVAREYMRRKRGLTRILLTKPFGTGADVLIPDIYQSSPREILERLNAILPGRAVND